MPLAYPSCILRFQFLSRNSVRWDFCGGLVRFLPICCFNSSVGILSVGTRQNRTCARLTAEEFQFLSRNSVRWDERGGGGVSFCAKSFNSSVGILSVGTKYRLLFCGAWKAFQFLSRNSVRWDPSRLYTLVLAVLRFNSSVGILSVGTNDGGREEESRFSVSIPQSEFCPLGRRRI